jgi:endonuclease III-like uncharacterized protein
MDKMNDEMKEKMVKKLADMGIEKDMIDEKLMWVTQKVYFKLMKLRLILSEKNIDEEKAKAIIEKLVAKSFDKDLADIKKWHEEHSDEYCKDNKDGCHKDHEHKECC